MLHDLFNSGVPVAEKLVRTLIVYIFLLVGLRLAGKREMGQLNPFDFVVLLLLSNTVQNAIIGRDDSLIGGIIGATALLLVNWFVVRYLFGHPRMARIIEGDPAFLIRNGKLRHERLKHELITEDDLESAARRQGIDGLQNVESCRLEVGGELTFIEKEPSAEEKRHTELVRHLETLQQSHATLLDRVSRIERL